MLRARTLSAAIVATLAMPAVAHAQTATGGTVTQTESQTHTQAVDVSTTANASGGTTTTTTTTTEDVSSFAEVDAPPPQRPRKPGFVVESSIGALGFAGKFRHVAPTAPWFHALFGYEPTRFLMVFIEGEISYTDNSVAEDETKQRAFPIFGGGGGLRGTWHMTDRFALYLQGEADVLEADTVKNELGLLGYEGMEKLRPAFGGRIGFEWYQRDRHLAFAVAGGLRDATGFAPSTGVSDLPLVWDAAANVRYTF